VTEPCSIVIPVHNRAGLTRQCVDAILADPPGTAFEIVVVDDVSTDSTATLLAGYGDSIRVVRREHNGGFASVRSRPRDLGAPGAVNYALDVRGDGKRYKLNLRTDDTFDGVNYQAVFEPSAGAWTLVQLALSGFRPTFRGRSVPDAPPLDPARVRQMGLMIADRQAGRFALAVRSIRVE